MKSPRRVGAVLGLMTAGLATTCGVAPANAAGDASFWVFFGTYTDSNSKGIYVSHLAPDGRLSAPQLAAESANPAFLAIDPQQRFLYAVNEVYGPAENHGSMVSAFAIDATTGKLSPLNQMSSVTVGPCHVSVDATGKVVLVANYGGGSIESFPILGNGSLGPVSSVIHQNGSGPNRGRQNEPHAHWLGVDPSNRYALLCDLGIDQLLIFKLDPATATLTPHEPPFARTASGSGPRHLAFGPNGKFVYVINELDCTMSVYAWDAGRGELSGRQTVSTLPPGEVQRPNFSTAEVVVHPSGRFLYGSNRGHDSIVVYAIDESSGELSLVEHVSSGGKVPRSFNVDPSGRFLLSANQESATVVVFAIDERTGRLTPTGAKVELEKPVCVVFTPAR